MQALRQINVNHYNNIGSSDINYIIENLKTLSSNLNFQGGKTTSTFVIQEINLMLSENCSKKTGEE